MAANAGVTVRIDSSESPADAVTRVFRRITPEASPTNAFGVHRNPSPITPKAFANFSPGLERSDNPGYKATSPFKP